MVILNIGRIMVELSGGWCLTDRRRYWDRVLSWCSVPLRDPVLLLMNASLPLRGVIALYILSVPNGGGFSLHIEGGVPARVSWPWGGKPGVLGHDSALLRSLVSVGRVDDFLTSFWLDRLLRCLGRSLVDGMFITDDGVTVMFPFLGGGV